jgi:hypothetical protein
MSVWRWSWWVFAVPIGLVGLAGAVVSASIAWVVVVFALVALALGALSANLQSLDCEGFARGRMSGATVVRHGCVAGAVVVAMFGLSSLIGAAMLPLAALMGVTSPGAVDWWRARQRISMPVASIANHPEPRTPRHDHRAEGTWPAVATMTDHELCLAWRRSYVELERADSAESRAAIAGFRGRVLDELERRNPTGFEDWLASGARAAGDPARYVVRAKSPGKML